MQIFHLLSKQLTGSSSLAFGCTSRQCNAVGREAACMAVRLLVAPLHVDAGILTCSHNSEPVLAVVHRINIVTVALLAIVDIHMHGIWCPQHQQPSSYDL